MSFLLRSRHTFELAQWCSRTIRWPQSGHNHAEAQRPRRGKRIRTPLPGCPTALATKAQTICRECTITLLQDKCAHTEHGAHTITHGLAHARTHTATSVYSNSVLFVLGYAKAVIFPTHTRMETHAHTRQAIHLPRCSWDMLDSY